MLKVIVALAATLIFNGIQASAAVALPTGNLFCSDILFETDCTEQMGASQLPEVNGVAGMKFFTTTPIFLPVFTDEDLAGNLMIAEVDGALVMPLIARTQIPVSFNFDLTTTGSFVITEWELLMYMYRTDDFEDIGDVLFSGVSAGQNRSGSGTLTTLLDASEVAVGFELAVLGTGTGGFVFSSPSSINFGALADPGAGVPEPASMALAGLGLAGLVVWRRQNRTTSPNCATTPNCATKPN